MRVANFNTIYGLSTVRTAYPPIAEGSGEIIGRRGVNRVKRVAGYRAASVPTPMRDEFT
jgi:hypothetical protein